MSTLSLQTLAAVSWGGLALMSSAEGLDAVVTNVDGWYDTPDVVTNDVLNVLADGGLFGPKVTKPREVTISGSVVGTRQAVMQFRDQLASRMVSTVPSELTITDPLLGTSLTSVVRASGPMNYAPIGRGTSFNYQLPVIASDPRLYSSVWSSRTIVPQGSGAATGRAYQRSYSSRYASPQAAGIAALLNPGNIAAPVQAIYTGPLAESRLTNGRDTIHMDIIPGGVSLLVPTDSLLAQASGGVSRASYVLPGSTPMLLPAQATTTWSLLTTGTGSVALYWRGAYA